jgi:hypothetical protein
VAHCPFTQLWPLGQACPQPPQLFTSLVTSVQTPPQQSFPFRQSPLLPQVQALLTQLSPAAQVWPQKPQLWASLVVFTSQPSLACWLQSA